MNEKESRMKHSHRLFAFTAILILIMFLAITGGIYFIYHELHSLSVAFEPSVNNEIPEEDIGLIIVINSSDKIIDKLEITVKDKVYEFGRIPGNYGKSRRKIDFDLAGTFVMSVEGQFDDGKTFRHEDTFYIGKAEPLQISINGNGDLSF